MRATPMVDMKFENVKVAGPMEYTPAHIKLINNGNNEECDFVDAVCKATCLSRNKEGISEYFDFIGFGKHADLMATKFEPGMIVTIIAGVIRYNCTLTHANGENMLDSEGKIVTVPKVYFNINNVKFEELGLYINKFDGIKAYSGGPTYGFATVCAHNGKELRDVVKVGDMAEDLKFGAEPDATVKSFVDKVVYYLGKDICKFKMDIITDEVVTLVDDADDDCNRYDMVDIGSIYEGDDIYAALSCTTELKFGIGDDMFINLHICCSFYSVGGISELYIAADITPDLEDVDSYVQLFDTLDEKIKFDYWLSYDSMVHYAGSLIIKHFNKYVANIERAVTNATK